MECSQWYSQFILDLTTGEQPLFFVQSVDKQPSTDEYERILHTLIKDIADQAMLPSFPLIKLAMLVNDTSEVVNATVLEH